VAENGRAVRMPGFGTVTIGQEIDGGGGYSELDDTDDPELDSDCITSHSPEELVFLAPR
jgi:hypothetical protein